MVKGIAPDRPFPRFAGRQGPSFRRVAAELAEVGRGFYARNWVLGTSGNFSAVLSPKPQRLIITASGAHKGTLGPASFLEVDQHGQRLGVSARPGGPSAETLLHLEILRARDAGAVLHTHSVWTTMLSDLHASARGFAIEGLEMLKGLDGVATHRHREWVPVVDNDQDMPRLAGVVRDTLAAEPHAHAFVLRGHGLYTWGRTIADAARHVEILEFLFEVIGRKDAHGHHPGS